MSGAAEQEATGGAEGGQLQGSPLEGRSARAGSGEMFDAIAARYDLMNRLVSMGLDQGWRKEAVRALELASRPKHGTVLDLATGTADLALAIAEAHDVRVLGIDPSEKMLAIGREKVKYAHLSGRVSLRLGDAQALDLDDQSVDGVTMAFGIRNVPDRAKALREMARVTKDGGRVAILELSEPREGVLSKLAQFHIHTVVPWLGSVLSGAPEYGYLQRSIAAFPPPEEFAEVMRASGLDIVSVEPMTFGVVCLFVGTPSRAARSSQATGGGRAGHG
ncbi:bifunctional demethylmenaquinone methyltransferase/2-methoxy-6-polyprenyl-1,4-benzoquinol methylase UbiE [Chondromyces crocatus]|uniref:Demethylmenaquinone methyltransferase n=1 Tax=Chondromyces crocatus TaxID=52 RepID=A0A0K1EHP7_CHOCO|nr:bifunctional demethylmenaquinone methyltransferase/2-methoxy-6-polyprenyl-1,4-benzoquinol methylase UbiE [Chondromyces crocatus]AKT40202.1 ubiquinone/menaquinone biosynthesis methyltransferase [Chondromyces crocatus]